MRQSVAFIAEPACRVQTRKPAVSREELLRRLWAEHNMDGSAR
jgi:hypothetical protein